MRRSMAAWLAFLLLAGTGWGQSVKLPAEVKGEPGNFITVRAESDGPIVKWYTPDGGLSAFPSDLLADKKVTVVVAQRAGRYRLVAWTAKGDMPSEPAVCIVIVGNAPGPGPDPGPDPKPPDPDPSDPLFKPLQAAYTAEADAEKAAIKSKFVEFYAAAAATAKRPDLNTWGALFRVMDTVAASEGIKGKLPGVQQVIRDEYAKQGFPTAASTVIDDAGKTKAAATFTRISTLLGAVK